MRHLFFAILILGAFLKANSLFSQTKSNALSNKKPRLVVGIVVDQMRNDYIYRYWNRYGNGGFKRLVNEGFYFKNAHYNYTPTYTGPGHCSIYTGTTPKSHGIIANDWFLKASGKYMYCVDDSSVSTVGSNNKNGLKSPKNQLSSTIGDEMKMSSTQRSKVFSVALKDRSSILPGGHMADAAFWYDDDSGNFISSSWYLKELPQWLKDFNDKKFVETYLEKGWQPLYALDTYTNSLPDENNYENAANKKEKAVFPYDYKTFLDKNNYSVIESTPYGNSITKDLAMACIINEGLGNDEVTDLFSLSFSSTDHVGHYYGPRSVEIEDIYLRLDKDMEEFLNFLDKQVGKNNYTVFLTADHGGSDVPTHLLDNKSDGGYIKQKQLVTKIKNFFYTTYGDSLLYRNTSNEQVFIDEKKVNDLKLDKNKVEETLAEFLITIKGIAEAYPSAAIKNKSGKANDYLTLLANGYNQKLSGNVCYIYEPGWMYDGGKKVVTHCGSYNYDTHVPVLFYGNGIKKGDSFKYISITQIAPTICELLQINQPNSTIAEPLNDFFK